MTDKDWTDLGRRAVACRAWRWMPGMLAYRPGGIWAWRHISVAKWADSLGIRSGLSLDALVPDLRDPATLGCLLALVREAYPGCAIWVARDCVVDPLDDTEYMLDEREGWTVCGGSGDDYLSPYGSGRTEAAALVAALESAQGLGQSS